MPPAAKITISHACPNHGPSVQVSGSGDTLIGHLPAGRLHDVMSCGAPVVMGSPTVLINHKMAARLGDPTGHGGVLVSGHPTVLIGVPAQGSTLASAAAAGTPFCAECEKAREEQARLAELRGEETSPANDSAPSDEAGPVDPPNDGATVVDQPPTPQEEARTAPPAQLAAAPNAFPDDGLNAARVESREDVARSFLQKACSARPMSWTAGVVSCIDLQKPLAAITSRAGLPSLSFSPRSDLLSLVDLKSQISSAVNDTAKLATSALRPVESILSRTDFGRAVASAQTAVAKAVPALGEELGSTVQAHLSRLAGPTLNPSLGGAVEQLQGLALGPVASASPALSSSLLSIAFARTRLAALPR